MEINDIPTNEVSPEMKEYIQSRAKRQGINNDIASVNLQGVSPEMKEFIAARTNNFKSKTSK